MPTVQEIENALRIVCEYKEQMKSSKKKSKGKGKTQGTVKVKYY
jgi:hypothetical protein